MKKKINIGLAAPLFFLVQNGCGNIAGRLSMGGPSYSELIDQHIESVKEENNRLTPQEINPFLELMVKHIKIAKESAKKEDISFLKAIQAYDYRELLSHIKTKVASKDKNPNGFMKHEKLPGILFNQIEAEIKDMDHSLVNKKWLSSSQVSEMEAKRNELVKELAYVEAFKQAFQRTLSKSD